MLVKVETYFSFANLLSPPIWTLFVLSLSRILDGKYAGRPVTVSRCQVQPLLWPPQLTGHWPRPPGTLPVTHSSSQQICIVTSVYWYNSIEILIKYQMKHNNHELLIRVEVSCNCKLDVWFSVWVSSINQFVWMAF